MRWHWQLITIWTNEHVYLIVSEESEQLARVKSCMSMKSGTCSSLAYASLADGIMDGRNIRSVRKVWAVLSQSFPFGSFEEIPSRGYVGIPDWIEQCWSSLPMEYLPKATFCGMDVLKQYFARMWQSAVPGSAFYAALDGRGYFFGYGEQEPFIRVSKDAMTWLQQGRGFSDDWLQQTGMLYRNRTGFTLSRIHILEDSSQALIQPADEQVRLESGFPGIEYLPRHSEVPILVQCIGSAMMKREVLNEQVFQLLQRRADHSRVAYAFQLGAGLLLLGWVCLLLGACKQESIRKDSGDLLQEWENARKTWQTGNDRFIEKYRDMKEQGIEMSLIGLIGSSVPSTFRLERIRIQNVEDSGKDLLISITGEIDAVDGSGAIHDWLDDLIRKEVIHRVIDLKLNQTNSALKFHLQGDAAKGLNI